MTSTSLYLNNLIYNSRNNIISMLKTRGFNTKEYENYTQDELILLLEKHQQGKFQNALELSPLDIKLTDNDDRTIIIKYRLDEKFKKTEILLKHINDIFETYKLNKDTDCVIIMNINRILIKPGTKDDPVQGFVNLCYLKKMFVQIYGLENFMFNITKHQFVPKHTILNNDESINVLLKYNVKIQNLPKINREDPIVKFIGGRPNQIIKIDNFNPTTGLSINYRFVVKSLINS